MASVLANKSIFSEPEWAEGPAWLRDIRQAAWKRFESLPMPKRGDEPWRFANLKQLDFEKFSLGNPTGFDLDVKSLSETTARLVFHNGHLLHSEGPSSALVEKGLLCLPFAEAAEKHGELLQEHFMAQDFPLGGEKFAALHKAYTNHGIVIHVPDGLTVSDPIEVFHFLGGEEVAAFPHTLVITGSNASVTLVERHRSIDDQAGWSCGVADFVAGQGSQIRHITCQNLNERSKYMQMNASVSGADANIKTFQFHLGSSWVRTEGVSHLTGKGANSDMLSVAVPADGQEFDQRTLQHHAAPHTTSDLLYKNALYGKARNIFAGLIMVDEGAHYTDAYQTCRNLMTSDEAQAHSMPGLEINADQVKCSHGSTSGQISKEEIFYFAARGIPETEARDLITMGFTQEVIDRIDNEGLETMVAELVQERFRGLKV